MIGSLNSDTITDNVFVTDGGYPDQIVLFVCGDKHNVIKHNTLANGASIRFQNDGCGSNVYETVYDNVVTGSVHADAGLSMSTATVAYNLTPGSLAGTNNLVGRPTYTGGSAPSSWAGYQLTSSSLGYKSASNGTDRGAGVFGPVTTTTTVTVSLPAPTNLRVQ